MDATVGRYLVERHSPPFRLPDATCPDRALLIVETRPCFFLPHVVASAVATHPGWRLYVVGTPAVHALLEETCENYGSATRVTLDGPIDVDRYSRLMVSDALWQTVREEHVLVFQSDCVLVRPTPEEFLGFAYVGAVCGSLRPDAFVMNGGLSLRRRSAMLEANAVVRTDRRLSDLPEDVALCEAMRRRPDRFALPTIGDCMRFAIETVGDAKTAVGLHGTDKYYADPGLVRALLEAP